MRDHATMQDKGLVPADPVLAEPDGPTRFEGFLLAAVCVLVGAVFVQTGRVDDLTAERDRLLLSSQISSARDQWDCAVLREERYAVCKLPPHAEKIESYVHVHRGCC